MGFVLLTRLPTRSDYLFSWDSVNFALAMDEWNLTLHQPHPPGYIAYVGLARVARLFGVDHNLALQLVAMLATGLAGWVWWKLARRLGIGKTPALSGLALLLTSPLVWLYSSVAEVYAFDMLSTLLVVMATYWDDGSRRSTIKIAAAFALAASVRLPTAVLLLPLTLVVRDGSVRRFLVSVATLLAAVAIFALDPAFIEAFAGHVSFTTSATRVWGGSEDAFRAINRNARDLLRTVLMSGVGMILLVLWLGWRHGPGVRIDRRLAAAWAIPMLAVFVGLHFGKQGYLLPLLPLVVLYVAAGAERLGPRGTWLVVCGVIIQVGQFLLAAPFSSEAAGADKRYRDKTLIEKAATELNPVTFATVANLKSEDERVTKTVDRVRRECPGEGVVVVGATEPLDWRRALFYLPEQMLVQFDPAGAPLLVARERRVRVVTVSEKLQTACTPLWLGSSAPPLIAGTATPDAATSAGVWRLEGDVTFTFGDGQQLQIAR